MKDSTDCAALQITPDMSCKRYKLRHEAPIRPLGANVKYERLHISEDVSNRLHRQMSEYSHARLKNLTPAFSPGPQVYLFFISL